MAEFLGRDGSPRVPDYRISINDKTCIGCGRCFKVRSRDKMGLHDVDEASKSLGKVTEDDDDDFDGKLNHKVMAVDNPGASIGCAACDGVRPKNCQIHAPA